MAKLIGTAGHVDHGKTTLIQALTGIDADRLPEEKSRGMTIDIGFASIDLPGVGRVSIVDVPGHEKFLTNMLVGALGVDVALICIAADESIMPQTREHIQILDLLPVQRVVVALTKTDLAGAELTAMAESEIEDLLANSRFSGSPILRVSSLVGQGLGELKAALTEALGQCVEPPEGLWYLPIDRVFSVKGFGTVVTGTLVRGSVKVGDTAVIHPGELKTRVRGIQWHDQDQRSAERGRRTALNLGGVKVEDIARGHAVGAPGALFESRIFDAEIRWISVPKHAQRVRVSIGADEVIGKIFLSEEESGIAQFRLERPIAAALGEPLIVRRYSPADLLGGGKVVVPVAQPRSRRERSKFVATELSDEERLMVLISSAATGIATEEACRALGQSPQELGSTFEHLKQSGRLLGFAGLWTTPDNFESAADRLLASLRSEHAKHPTRAFLPRERVVLAAELSWSGKPLDRILSELASRGALRVQGTEIALPGHKIELSSRQSELLDRVEEVLDRLWPNVPKHDEIASHLRVPVQAVPEIITLGVQSGQLIRIADEIHYTKPGFQRLIDVVRDLAARGSFSAAEFKEAIGSSRKFAIPILEYLDSVRFTVRIGERRVLAG